MNESRTPGAPRLGSIIAIAGIALLGFATGGQSMAAPTVTSVSGVLAEGATLTIAGANLGAGPNVILYDDFEQGTNGSVISTGAGSARIGSWSSVQGTLKPRYDNRNPHSGSLSMRADMSQHWVEYIQANFPDPIGNGEELYASWWVFLPATDRIPGEGTTDLTNWKQMWIQGEGGTTDDDLVVPVLLPQSAWFVGGNNSPYVNWTETGWVKGRWSRFELWAKIGYSNNGSFHFATLDSVNGHVNREAQDSVSLFYPDGEWRWARLNGYGRVTPDSHPTFDDVYFAGGPSARARVEVCDSATYLSSSTRRCAICATGMSPATWSSSSIQCSLRGGAFSAGAPLWLFVINGAGQASPGFSVGEWGASQGSSTTTTPPEAPPNVHRDLDPDD